MISEVLVCVGYDEVCNVCVGKIFDIEIEVVDCVMVERCFVEVCDKLFVNMIVEDFFFELEEFF